MFKKELREYDPQLILWFDPEKSRYVVLRQPERYGSVPKDGYSDGEIRRRIRFGALLPILIVERDGRYADPGEWVINTLRKMDIRRLRAKDFINDIDERNRMALERYKQKVSEDLRYVIRQDWKHIRDELRGDTIFRRWVQHVAVD
ncbi:MAG: hypothetical protein QXZ09_03470 [Candidatus Methanomethylicaceae archaeon]